MKLPLTLTRVDGWGYATLQPAHHSLGALCIPAHMHRAFCTACGSKNIGLPGTVHLLPITTAPSPYNSTHTLIRADFNACTWTIPTNHLPAILNP